MPEETPSQALPPVPPTAPAVDPEVLRLRGEVANNKRDLDALRSRISAPPQPAAVPQAQMSAADMAREFYKDPVGHAAAIASRVVEDRMRAEGQPQQASLIQMARDGARNKDSKLFDKYQLEIEAAVDTVAPQFRTNPTVWENAITLVKGKHIDEIIAERAAQAPQPVAPALHISKGDGPAPSSPRSASAPSTQELSVDEKRVARKLGITEQQYKDGKIHLEGQNDVIRDPVGPSSWDKQITFSSKDRRRRLRAEQQARRAS